MKKKRLNLVTTIALLAALAGGSGGVAWGQAYKKGYVYSGNEQRQKLRRGDATSLNSRGYIGSASNVNNEFGAGESAIVNSGSVTFPAPSHGLNMTNPSALRVGSEYSILKMPRSIFMITVVMLQVRSSMSILRIMESLHSPSIGELKMAT